MRDVLAACGEPMQPSSELTELQRELVEDVGPMFRLRLHGPTGRSSREEAKALLQKHEHVVRVFGTLAERVLAARDEYGDEDWEAYDREIQRAVTKVGSREGVPSTPLALQFERGMDEGVRQVLVDRQVLRSDSAALLVLQQTRDVLDLEFRSTRVRRD